MISLVTMREIEAIFEILDRLGVSREAVVIPLRPASPGSVSRRPDGRFEIVVEAERALDDWLPEVEARLVEMGAGGGPTAGPPGGADRGSGRP
ncbi:hypothetical protein KGQ64_01405 [bacterium]|nr:hypothetical protein [bacterium]